MAENTTKVVVEATDNGSISKLNTKAEQLHSSLEAAAKSATRIPKATAAARAGVAATQGIDNSRDSGTARGIGGQTGAEGRDFAKQAQGLGGLVHVYATFAANLFAISAAFGALSKAADTTNLIKGMDQLGAASGKNLGGLSKALVQATEGAITLRDAMSATALATSGGLSSENLLRLGKVAKTASQALGISMPDAVSRLTRGIVKLEPELLDELGIMVRLDKASQDYARSIGKSVSALTDFEKRQGFANAVLAQGERKFGEVNLDSNAYDRLLASIQNLSQAGLELINKVLGPIANMLSQSPAALATVLAGIASLLLKQAIPALGQYRKGLEQAAEASRARLVRIYNDQLELGKDSDVKAARAAEKAFLQQSSTVQRLSDLKLKLEAKNSSRDKLDYNSLSNKGAIDITDDELAILDKRAKNLAARQNQADKAESVALKSHLQDVRKIRQEFSEVGDEAARTNELKESGRFSHQTQLVKLYERARVQASSAAIQASTAEAAATMGPIRAYEQLNEQIKRRKTLGEYSTTRINAEGNKELIINQVRQTGALANGWDRVKGTITIATSALTTFASAFQNTFFVVGAIVGVFQILNSIFSSNSKEAAATSSAIEELISTSANLDRVLESIAKKDPLAAISTEAISARATAIYELGNSIGNTLDKFKLEIEKSNWWDTQIEEIKGLFGSGNLENSAKEFAIAISKELKAANPGNTRDKAVQDIGKILGVDPTDVKAIDAVLSKSPEKFLALAPRVSAALKTMGTEFANVASRGQQLDAAFTEASKTLDTILVSAIPKDAIAKLGIDTVAVGTQMAEAFKDPITALNQLAEITSNVSKLRLLNPDTASELLKLSPVIKTNVALVSAYSYGIEELTKKQEELTRAQKDSMGPSGRGVADKSIGKEIDDNAKNLKFLQARKAEAEAAVAPYLEKLKVIQNEVFANGASKIEASIGMGFAKAANAIQKSLADTLGNTIGGIEARAEVQKADIDLQIKQLEATGSLIDSTERLRLAQEESNILAQRSNVLNDPKLMARGERAKELDKLDIRLEGLRQATERYASNNPLPLVVRDLNVQGRDRASEVTRAGAQGALGAAAQKSGLESTKAGLSAQRTGIDIATELQVAIQLAALEKERLNTVGYIANSKRSLLDLQTKDLKFLSDTTLQDKNNLENQIAINKSAQEELAITLAIGNAFKVMNDERASPELQEKATKTLEEQLILLEQFDTKKTADTKLREAQQFQLGIDNDRNRFEQGLTLDKLKFDSTIAQENNLLTIREENMDKLNTAGSLSDIYIAQENVRISLEKERIRNKTENFNLEKDQALKLAALEAQKAKLPAGSADAAGIQAEINATNASYSSALANEKSLNDARLKNIATIGEVNVRLASQAEIMNNMVGITDSLGNIFGKMGESIGALGERIQNLANTELNYLKARNVLEAEKADIDKMSDSEDKDNKLKDYYNNISKLDSKNTKQQLTNTASIIGATKTMFNEKSRTYKTLDAIEKAIHLAKLAMMIKEVVVANATTASVVASNVAKSASNAVTAITAAFAAPFPVGFVAGAAMIAIMASIIGKASGRSAPSAPAGFSAESQQAVQGTGQTLNQDGTYSDRAGGVVGNASAKAESVDRAIENLEQHSFKSLEYSNKMLDALKSIKLNTDGLAQLLLQTLTNNNPNVKTGLQTGVISDPFGAQNKKFEDIYKFSTLDFLGGGQIAKTLGKAFGGQTTQSIEDLGIILNSTFDALTRGTEGLVQQYTNIKTETDGGWFHSDSTSFRTEFAALGRDVNRYIESLYLGIKTTLVEASTVFGKDASLTSSLIDAIKVSFQISAKGLKPEELAAAISASVSAAFNEAAARAFPELIKFQNLGEEMGNTIVRLARDSQLTGLALESIGMAVARLPESIDAATGLLTTRNIDIVESLIALTGGLETFVSSTEYFKDNFLTSAERLAPIQARVVTEMDRLGLSSVDTREEFAAVVKALDLTTLAGRQMYANLMNVAEAFATVYEETRKIQTEEEKRSTTLSQQLTLLKLLGKVTEAQNISRAEELAEMDQSLRAGQVAIYQLQDRLVFLKAESSILSALGYANEALRVDRELELRNLTDTEKALKRQVYAAQDNLKTNNLLIDLMEATGDATGALNAKRQAELNGLSDTDAAIKSRIYRLQDEAALKAKIKTAYDEESSAINSTITSLKSSIKTLQEYRTALKTGDTSTLNPLQKYNETKAQALEIAAAATMTAVTEAQKADQQAAIDKLPAATDAFLAASRVLNASSGQYTEDFNSVLALIATTENMLTNQKSDSELQLEALDQSVSHLSIIETNTQSTSDLLSQLVVLQSSMASIDVANSAANDANTAYVIPDVVFKQMSEDISNIFQNAMTSVLASNLGVTWSPSTGIDPVTGASTVPGGGVNYNGQTGQTTNDQLLAQLVTLTREVAGLRADQQAQTGDLIATNYDATQQAAQNMQDINNQLNTNHMWRDRSSFQAL